MSRIQRKKQVDSVRLIPTGSTLLNLVCSDVIEGAFKLGTINNIIGDSSAGKTMLSLSILAEMSVDKRYNDYLLIHDDVERRSFFNIKKLFGKKLHKRIQGPFGPVSESASTTVEEFYYSLDTLLEEGTPFIYILDSMDALGTEAAEKKFQENKEAFLKDKAAKGSYGDGKAAVNSRSLRAVAQRLRKTGSVVVVISQTRDNLGFGFSTKTRSGGRALEFYCGHVMWLSKTGKIKKTVKGKQRTIGVNVRCSVTKNSLTGRQDIVDFPLYYNYGLDDISSLLEYCSSEKVLQTKGTKTVWGDKEYSQKQMISFFEENGYSDLKQLAQQAWNDIAESLVPGRRPKYE